MFFSQPRLLRLVSLSLSAFRNYAQARLSLDGAQMVVLTGPNGAGKTNILEAVSLLSGGRGLRRAKLSELQKFQAESSWAVSACLSDDTQIGSGQDPDAALGVEKRVSVVNGARVRGQTALAEHFVVTWLTPVMERLWTEAPSARRRLVDRLTVALDPQHATRLSRYEDALAERNKLLKEGYTDDRWLVGVEHTLAGEGVAVAAARREMVRALQAQLLSPAQNLASLFPVPRLALNGVETWLDEGSALQVEDRMKESLAQSRRADLAAGHTSLGPHRSDLDALYVEKNMPAGLCSTGEQKAMLINLILAHARVIRDKRHMAPVVLLDEVAAHFDDNRKEALFQELIDLGGQVWLTGAEPDTFKPVLGRSLHVQVDQGQLGVLLPSEASCHPSLRKSV